MASTARTQVQLPGRGTWVPLAFVIVSLTALVALPLLTQRYTNRIRDEVSLVYEPARGEVGRVMLALGRQAIAAETFATTGNPIWIRRFNESGANLDRSLDSLETLVARIDPETFPAQLDSIRTTYGLWRSQVDPLIRGEISREGYAARIESEAMLADDALRAVANLEASIAVALSDVRRDARRASRIATWVNVALAVLALASTVLVVGVGRRLRHAVAGEREARGEAERRALEERALRNAIQALAASFTVEQVVERVASRAAAATGASGAIVTRVHLDTNELEVVAASGERVPEVGLRFPYPGSYAERVIDRGEPAHVSRLSEWRGAIPEPIIMLCPDCPALLVPLVNAGEAIGTLILIGASGREPFRADEIERAHAFGNLAAIAIRRVHMFEDSEERREALLRVMESRARLMRGFSHDVKNPLGAADGYLQLLESGVIDTLTEAQKESVGRARRSIRSALDLIDELLELARAETTQIEVRSVPTDVGEAVRQMAEEHRAQAEAKGLELIVEVPRELKLVRSDPSRIRQVLGNLLSNAVKYTERGRITVRAAVRSGPGTPGPGDWIVVDVADTGPGIPKDKHDFIFDEYTRADTGARPGAGVGLAISKRICHALGGDLTVESEPGRGAVFTMWLPSSDSVGGDGGREVALSGKQDAGAA